MGKVGAFPSAPEIPPWFFFSKSFSVNSQIQLSKSMPYAGHVRVILFCDHGTEVDGFGVGTTQTSCKSNYNNREPKTSYRPGFGYRHDFSFKVAAGQTLWCHQDHDSSSYDAPGNSWITAYYIDNNDT